MYTSSITAKADEIRAAAGAYLRRARQAGENRVAIRAGDIARELKLVNRTPSVCSALESVSFLRENHAVLERREGPERSTTTVFHYRLEGDVPLRESEFLGLRGAGKEAFAELGGAEKFIREERESFYR